MTKTGIEEVKMLCKIYTIQELIDTGLPLIHSTRTTKDIEIGQYYLEEAVINMWDVRDYTNYYTFFEDGIKHSVYVCLKREGVSTRYLLRKDLSNLPKKNEVLP